MSDLWPRKNKTTDSTHLWEGHLEGHLDGHWDHWDNEWKESTLENKVTASESKAVFTCPLCKDSDELQSTGGCDTDTIVCKRCGTIVDQPIGMGAEYRWYSGDSAGPGTGGDPSRCGFPVNHLMPESSIGTIILTNNMTPMMWRIRKWHMWSIMPSREHTLWKILDGLQLRASNASIGSAIVDEAKDLFAQLTASAVCRGPAQRDAVLAACIWESLKRHGASRHPKEIAEIFNIPLKQVTRGIKQFQMLYTMRLRSGRTDTYICPDKDEMSHGRRKGKVTTATEGATGATGAPTEETDKGPGLALRANLRRAVWETSVSKTISGGDFITPFATKLSIQPLVSTMIDMCERAEEIGVAPENTPLSMAASIIAFCCKECKLAPGIEIADVSRVCGVSCVTINKCLKRLIPFKEKLLEK